MIKKYMHYRRGILILYCMIFGVVAINQSLYQVTFEPVWYSVQITGFLVLLSGCIDFYFFQKRYRKLQNIQKDTSIFIHDLPKSGNIVEKSYEEIISSIAKRAQVQMNELIQSHTEQMDYYTLWVHQIKTPISAIRLLLSEKEDEESKLFEQELFKIEQYVEMVLQYLRIQNLSTDLVLQSYPLLPILKQCIKKYSSIFIYKKLSVDLEVPDISVITDEKWLSFIIEQILSNALKYTDEGGISITLMELEDWYELTIKDSGIGIRKEDINRIFEKGYTGYNGRMDKKASGIGLYLTKQVADTLRHPIEIMSTVNVGTSVSIILKKHQL